MRLQTLIQQTQGLSATKARKWIHQGKVQVDGQVVLDGNRAVDPSLQTISVANERVGESLGYRYVMYHKKKGQVSAKSDRQWPTPFDELPDDYQGLTIVGRLDRDVTGLLLLTDNGQWHYLMESDRFHIPKTYLVTVNGRIDDEMIRKFQKGVVWSDGFQCRPAQLEILETCETKSIGRLTITEGKRHQVKKMFLACGVKVIALERIALGPFTLDPFLEEGTYRPFTAEECQVVLDILKNYQR